MLHLLLLLGKYNIYIIYLITFLVFAIKKIFRVTGNNSMNIYTSRVAPVISICLLLWVVSPVYSHVIYWNTDYILYGL